MPFAMVNGDDGVPNDYNDGNADDEVYHGDDDYDGDDGQVRRFATAQPLLLAGINSKVRQLFPAIAEEEVIIVMFIIIAINIIISSLSGKC